MSSTFLYKTYPKTIVNLPKLYAATLKTTDLYGGSTAYAVDMRGCAARIDC